MSIITDANFIGFYRVAKDPVDTVIINQFCDDNENSYILKLLGAELGQLVITDLSGGNVPTDPLYQAIWLPFSFDWCGVVYESKGVLDMLTGFLYFQIQTDAKLSLSQATGVTRLKTEVAQSNNLVEAQISERWNRAVYTSRAIQAYICKNSGDYPLFNGQEFKLSY